MRIYRFYYANAGLQWQIFNEKEWVAARTRTRQTLANETSDDGWLIVTGTYDSCMLPDKDGKEPPLFLDPSSSIPVPLFYWKLAYNTCIKNGILYIGLNNLYQKIEDGLFLCENTCPGDYDNAGANQGLVYCCTKESLKEFYGELDPIVYKQFWKFFYNYVWLCIGYNLCFYNNHMSLLHYHWDKISNWI